MHIPWTKSKQLDLIEDKSAAPREEVLADTADQAVGAETSDKGSARSLDPLGKV
jgi:hypothetical protein